MDKINKEVLDYENSNISSGERSKIAIFRALNTNKELLIFDEILANIDEQSEEELTNYLLGLNKTIIIITHNLNQNNLNKFDHIIKF